MLDINKIYNEDCLVGLKKIPDNSIDLVVIDPPYDSDLGINSLKIISDSKDKILAKDGIIIYETDKNFITNYCYIYQIMVI